MQLFQSAVCCTKIILHDAAGGAYAAVLHQHIMLWAVTVFVLVQ